MAADQEDGTDDGVAPSDAELKKEVDAAWKMVSELQAKKGEEKKKRDPTVAGDAATEDLDDGTVPTVEATRALMERIGEDELSLKKVTAVTPDGLETIVLPMEWYENFEEDSLSVLFEGKIDGSVLFVGAAVLASSGEEVFFMARDTKNEATFRDLLALERLRASGCVPTLFATENHPDVTFVMMEPVSDGELSLELLLEQQAKSAEPEPLGSPFLPLSKSLPLMVDMLRALKQMEIAGVVQRDITEDGILILPEQHHAVLMEFGKSCFEGMKDSQVDCSLAPGELIGSAYRHSPEMKGECATSVSTNVWQMGLIFARMLLGGPIPTMSQVGNLDDESPEGRETIRRRISEVFSIRANPRYGALASRYSDILEILDGMLNQVEGDRWSAEECLQAAQAAALVRKIDLPPSRLPAPKPRGWDEDRTKRVMRKPKVEAAEKAEDESFLEPSELVDTLRDAVDDMSSGTAFAEDENELVEKLHEAADIAKDIAKPEAPDSEKAALGRAALGDVLWEALALAEDMAKPGAADADGEAVIPEAPELVAVLSGAAAMAEGMLERQAKAEGAGGVAIEPEELIDMLREAVNMAKRVATKAETVVLEPSELVGMLKDAINLVEDLVPSERSGDDEALVLEKPEMVDAMRMAVQDLEDEMDAPDKAVRMEPSELVDMVREAAELEEGPVPFEGGDEVIEEILEKPELVDALNLAVDLERAEDLQAPNKTILMEPSELVDVMREAAELEEGPVPFEGGDGEILEILDKPELVDALNLAVDLERAEDVQAPNKTILMEPTELVDMMRGAVELEEGPVPFEGDEEIEEILDKPDLVDALNLAVDLERAEDVQAPNKTILMEPSELVDIMREAAELEEGPIPFEGGDEEIIEIFEKPELVDALKLAVDLERAEDVQAPNKTILMEPTELVDMMREAVELEEGPVPFEGGDEEIVEILEKPELVDALNLAVDLERAEDLQAPNKTIVMEPTELVDMMREAVELEEGPLQLDDDLDDEVDLSDLPEATEDDTEAMPTYKVAPKEGTPKKKDS